MAKRRVKKSGTVPSRKKLEALIDEATADAYGEEEVLVGFFTLIQDNLAFPFETAVLGVPVTVSTVEMTAGNAIVAVCVRGRERQRIPILDLPLPSPRPCGWECIEAYRLGCNS